MEVLSAAGATGGCAKGVGALLYTVAGKVCAVGWRRGARWGRGREGPTRGPRGEQG